MNMHAETQADLLTAATAAREAKIVAKAFAYGPLGPRENNVLQGILRRAWQIDALAAYARIGRIARLGAESVKTGSRGHVHRRENVQPPIHVREAMARDEAGLRHIRKSQRTVDELAEVMQLTRKAAETVIARLRKQGKIHQVRRWGNFAVYGVVKA